MSQYNLDTIIDRRATNSLKWQVAENELPMWVADMDFAAAPEITAALAERVQHGVFGYETIPESWSEAVCGWWEARHHFTIRREWLVFCTGVVPAISAVIRKLTTPGEKVLVQAPVYNIFYNCIENNGRLAVSSDLRYDGTAYEMDFADLEQKLSDPQVTLMLLCNPHNPVGKLWERGTLAHIGELCRKHHVRVLSDEIHCDLTDPGREYIPFASVSEICAQNSITCIAPTKAFNLAGLQTAAVVVPDETLRHKVWRGLNTDEAAEPNSFAVAATIAAFTKGAPWLDALRAYLFENKQAARTFIAKELPQLSAVSSEATYLLWLDCRKLYASSAALSRFIGEKTGLWLTEGSEYGKAGEGFLRMNIACPYSRLEDGLARLKTGITAYEAWMASLC